MQYCSPGNVADYIKTYLDMKSCKALHNYVGYYFLQLLHIT